MSYGQLGELTQLACLQDDLAPIDDGDGVHRTVYVRDQRGAIVEESYFAGSGQRTQRRSDGCARRRLEYDAAGSLVKESCLDASGVPQRVAGNTQSAVAYTREKNGCWTEKRYLGSDNRTPETTRLLQRTDQYCTALDFERRTDEGKIVGVAWDAELTPDGLVAVMRSRAEHGHAQCPNAGYYSLGTIGSMVKWDYDASGRPTRKRCFRSDATPSRCDESHPHEQRYAYDEAGRNSSISYFDEDGEPATWFGVHRKEMSYNVLGRLTGDRYYDTRGERTNDRCGTGGNAYRFDAKQRLTQIDQRDKDGNLKTSRCRVSLNGIRWPVGSVRVKVVRTPDGATKNEYYNVSGRLMKTVDCSEPNAERSVSSE